MLTPEHSETYNMVIKKKKKKVLQQHSSAEKTSSSPNYNIKLVQVNTTQ